VAGARPSSLHRGGHSRYQIVDNIGADLVESIITFARMLIRHVVAAAQAVSLTTKSRVTWKESNESPSQ